MAKVMIFVDGSWLYANTSRLADSYGKQGFQIDFGKLPSVLADAVRSQLGNTEVDVVRTYLFGSYASNQSSLDENAAQRRLDFYDMLREEHHYEVEVFPINYRGRRLRRADRDPKDTFEAKEKCVDISLATSMLYFAAIPFAYDIAIAVLGDQDFKPVLQHVRRLGKRVAVASVKGSCSEELSDPTDQARVKDCDLIWIDDLLHKLELKYEPHQLECESPIHKGERRVWTTFYPRKGRRFYCDDCKSRFERQKQEQQEQYVNQSVASDVDVVESVGGECIGQLVIGRVTNIVTERQFAFMKTAAGNEYYFNAISLAGEAAFDQISIGAVLKGEVFRLPGDGKAGAVKQVHSAGANDAERAV